MLNVVGQSVPRKDGIGKATGQARYTDDLHFPGMLYGRTVRTTIPCGHLSGVRLDFDAAGFTLVDHRDIPGRNVIALIADDQPCLVEREIRHAAEPVLLLAHESREALIGASVTLDQIADTPLFDPERRPPPSRRFSSRKETSPPGSPGPITSSKARTARATRSTCTSSPRASSPSPKAAG